MTVPNRLALLREVMANHNLAGYLIPTDDSHQSEYTAEHFQARAYFSGFTGSAGTLVVLKDSAALWADGRYYLQAEAQIAGSGITLMKDGLPDTPTIAHYLLANLPAAGRLGLDSKVHSYTGFNQLKTALELKKIELIDADLTAAWPTRPALVNNQIYLHNLNYVGFSAGQKLGQVRAAMVKANADAYFISSLDDIAWLTNLRGSDITYNPFFYSYALITQESAALFTNNPLTAEAANYLQDNGFKLNSYEQAEEAAGRLYGAVFIDGSRTSAYFAHKLLEQNILVQGDEIIAELKVWKNEAELEGFKEAHLDDGLAMVNFLYWLNHTDITGLTEYDLVLKLEQFRAQSDCFIGMSFASITGMGANGAIVHYSAGKDNGAPLTAGLIVVDSGGQYSSGTTDITRTLHLGEPTAAEIYDYTLVLKSLIMLNSAAFFEGATGAQLDGIARYSMWQASQNYNHGTGHGLGSALAVHEGPVGINGKKSYAVKAGAVMSIEPGIYKANQYGIRLENVVYSAKFKESAAGNFLQFINLTLCPFEEKLINKDMLSKAELEWLASYHQNVYAKLANFVEPKVQEWLKELCRPSL
ncbi:MAG: aminopeptidase P family N-terminal domain-containing protein [Spirochaetaceae bacterium]|nr:aminopeptidase P family N-terminal domain-containing protein [Spirochaetaceae bacterium]